MAGRFGFLLFDQFEDLDFVGPWEIIGIWSQKFNGPDKLLIINENGDAVTSTKGLTFKPSFDFSTSPELDYLLIPGGFGTRTEVYNSNLLSFIKARSLQCKYILSVCTGAFLLQAAGLLNGKSVTTHVNSLNRLKEFKELKVIDERYVKDGNLWTSAGISAGIDMSLAFVADTAGEEVAGKIQLEAEYFPAQKIYTKEVDSIPVYARKNR